MATRKALSHVTSLVSALAAAALLPGCDPKPSSPPTPSAAGPVSPAPSAVTPDSPAAGVDASSQNGPSSGASAIGGLSGQGKAAAPAGGSAAPTGGDGAPASK